MVTYKLTRRPTTQEIATQIVPGTVSPGGLTPEQYAQLATVSGGIRTAAQIAEQISPPIYTSPSLSGQTFTSKEAMLKAEKEFKLEQQKQTELSIQRQAEIQERTIAGQITPGTTGVGGGLFYVTPSEAEKLRGKTTRPYWEVESPTTIPGMVEAIDIESRYAGAVQVPISDLGYGVPRGAYEQTAMQIKLQKEGFKIERELRKDIFSVSKQFEKDPTIFKGQVGFFEEEVEGGRRYRLEPSYFETMPSFLAYQKYAGRFGEEGFLKTEEYDRLLKEAKQQFMGLEKPVRIKAAAGEVQLAFMRTEIGLGQGLISFATQLGVQTFPKEAERTWYGGIKGKGFEFGGRAKEIMQIPTVQPQYKWYKEPGKYVGEIITTRPAVSFPVGAIAGVGLHIGKGLYGGVKQYGLKTGVIETTKYFSPLRIRGTYWTPDISKEFIAGHKGTLRVGKRDLTTIEFVKGKAGVQITGAKTDLFGIKLKQISYSELIGGGKTAGVSATTLEGIPYAKYIGGKLTFGTLPPQQYVSLFGGYPTGKYTFRTNILTGKLGGGWTKTTAAGFRVDITKPIGKYQMKLFGFTGGERVAGFEKISPKTYQYLQGFQPSLRGYGLTFRAPQPPPKTGIKVYRGGLGRISSQAYLQSLYQQTYPLQPPTIQGISQVSKVAFDTSTFGVSGIAPSVWAGTGLYEKYKPSEEFYGTGGREFGGAGTMGVMEGRIKTKWDFPTVSVFKPIIITKGEQKLISVPAGALGQRLLQAQTQAQRLKLKTELRMKQLQRQIPRAQTPFQTIFGGGAIGGISGFPFLFPPLRLGGGWGERRRFRRRLKQPQRYIPSLTASILRITGREKPYLIHKRFEFGFTPGIRPIIIKPKTKRKKKRK